VQLWRLFNKEMHHQRTSHLLRVSCI